MAYPTPQPGASLLLAHRLQRAVSEEDDDGATSPPSGVAADQDGLAAAGPSSPRRTVLIVGTARLAASRLFACAEAGAWPVIVAPPSSASVQTEQSALASQVPADDELNNVADEIKHRIRAGECSFITLRAGSGPSDEEEQWVKLLEALDGLPAPVQSARSPEKQKLAAEAYTAAVREALRSPAAAPRSVAPQIFAACITTTLHTAAAAASEAAADAGHGARAQTVLHQAKLLTRLCRARRIPLTVADHPELCDFSFPASHRFTLASSPQSSSAAGEGAASGGAGQSNAARASCLQVAVTTNGKGCRLAGRIRREIVTLLPRNVADAVENIGSLRTLAKGQDQVQSRDRARERSMSRSRSRSNVHVDLSSSGSGASAPRSHARTSQQEDDESFDAAPLNSPVPQLRPGAPQRKSYFATHGESSKGTPEDAQAAQEEAQEEQAEREERTRRRMRWVAQMSEYWPIDYLGNLDRKRMVALLDEYQEREEKQTALPAAPPVSNEEDKEDSSAVALSPDDSGRGRSARAVQRSNADQASGAWSHRRPSQHSLILPPPATQPVSAKGHIYLIGSGPGHPALLTMFAHRLLTSPETHLVLSDKLVPSAILSLIPPSTPLVIARKFPGNAEGAQSELIALALKAAVQEGKTVVRLKQGDPFVYGRGGEEVLAFRKAGIESTVVPGISSSIAGPAMLGIAVTQRGAADSMILCTGVGRGGKKVKLPGYERSRSLVVLMGVARIAAVVEILTRQTEHDPDRDGAAFPPYLPIAIVERASSADQRVIASTLDGIVAATEHVGEQRPPGMILIGWTVLALEGEGDTSVLDDATELADAVAAGSTAAEAAEELHRRDVARLAKWLDGRRYVVREGLDQPYSEALRQAKAMQEAPIHSAAQTPRAGSPVRAAAATGDAVGTRSQHGWAEGRYKGQAPEGGWVPGESANVPAANMAQYIEDLSIPDKLKS